MRQKDLKALVAIRTNLAVGAAPSEKTLFTFLIGFAVYVAPYEEAGKH